MWKKTRTPLVITLCIALSAAFFSWKLNFLNVPVKIGLENLTGQRVAFQRIEYRFFNRISIRNISIGTSFTARDITVYLNPLRLVTALKSPQDALVKIQVNAPRIDLTPESISIFKRLTATAPSSAAAEYHISWDAAAIRFRGMALERASGHLKTGTNLSARMNGFLGSDQLAARLSSEPDASDARTMIFDAELTGAETNVALHSEHRISSASIVSTLAIPSLRWRALQARTITGSGTWSPAGYTVSLDAPRCRMLAHGTTPGDWQATADITVSEILAASSGTIHADVIRSSAHVAGVLTTTELSLNGMQFGNSSCSFSGDETAAWTAQGTMTPAGYAISARGEGTKNITASLAAGSAGTGTIHGQLAPFDIAVDVYNWPVRQLPGTLQYPHELSGTIDIHGFLRQRETMLTASLRSVQAGASDPQTIKARLSQTTAGWACTAESRSRYGIWSLSGKRPSAGAWESTLLLDRCQIQHLLPLAGLALPVTAAVSGKIAYTAAGRGEIRLAVNSISWKGTACGNGRVHAEISPDEIRVRETSLHTGRGTLTFDAHLGRGDALKTSQAVLRLYHFPVRKTAVHGEIRYSGTISDRQRSGFAGVVESAKLVIGSTTVNNLRIPVSLQNGMVRCEQFSVDSFLSGDLSVQLHAPRALAGTIAVRKLRLERVAPSVSGSLKADLVLNGTLAAPLCNASFTASDCHVRDLPFTAAGTIRVRGNGVYAESCTVSSGRSSVQLSGTCHPSLNLRCALQDIDLAIGSKLFPDAPRATGTVNGGATVTGSAAAPSAVFDIRGSGLSINRTRLDELSARGTASPAAIVIAGGVVKQQDSEVRLLPDSSVRLGTHEFSLAAELRNVHAIAADVFGAVTLRGRWEPRTAEIRCAFTGSNLWINQHNLEKLSGDVLLRGKKLLFTPHDQAAVRISGRIGLALYPQISFDRFTIAAGQGSAVITGDIGAHFWNFSVTGRGIDAAAAAELGGSPVACTGRLEATLNGKGSSADPQLDARLDLTNGSIGTVPVDTATLQASVRRDVLTVTNARFSRAKQFSLAASGFLPFFLSAERRKALGNNPMDLTVNLSEGTIDLLRTLVPEISGATGELRSQARLTGTLARPVVNGYLRVTNGAIVSARYLRNLSRLAVDLQWKDNTLTIRDFSARSGDGFIRLKGGAVFDGLRPQSYRVTLFTEGKKGVRVTIPELPIKSPLLNSADWQLLSSFSNGEPRFLLQLSGTGSAPVLSGWAELENTHFTYPPPPGRKGDGDDPLAAFWPYLSWDLTLRTGKNCWYENELASVNVSGGIHLTGKGATPQVAGRIESVHGNITYLGTEFKIKQAVVEIVKDGVYLEGEASTEAYATSTEDADTIHMYIDKAEIGKISPRFVSKNNPKMTPEKALARATGVDPERYETDNQAFLLRQQLIRLFDSTLTTPLAKNLLRKSGIVDTFRVQYQTQEPIKPTRADNPTLAELLYGTKYSLEKYLTDQILFGYSVTFDQLQNRLDLRHELEVSYQLQRNIFLKGSYELESRDPQRQHDRRITLEQQWRFGWPRKK